MMRVLRNDEAPDSLRARLSQFYRDKIENDLDAYTAEDSRLEAYGSSAA
ncbi:hypothetical protein [Sphingomonas sp. R1]|nr:hypothetical protein [Sphingomonas sp. R1]UYY79458.1 hypothetical protein OIM94_18505 [Sphingomonas sp. R1]